MRPGAASLTTRRGSPSLRAGISWKKPLTVSASSLKPEREIQIGIGPIAVRRPKLRDSGNGKGGEGIRFPSWSCCLASRPCAGWSEPGEGV
jgi:hypothetical protein